MSVEKYNELGAEGYQKWRAEQAAARRVAPRPRVIVDCSGDCPGDKA